MTSAANYTRYQELHNLMRHLHEGQFELILDWCNKNVVANKHDLFDDLLFDIHSQKYCSLLSQGLCEEALFYAKANFGAFKGTKIKELKQLMTKLAFVGPHHLQQCTENRGNAQKFRMERLLQEAFCKLYGLALSSPMNIW